MDLKPKTNRYRISLILFASLSLVISCRRKLSKESDEKIAHNQYTHHILFYDNKGDAYLKLDSTLNDNYFYSAADCIMYFDHCIKPKNYSNLQRGFFWYNLQDSLHHLILSYLPETRDSLNLQRLIELKKDHEYFKKSRFVFNKKNEPYLITKVSKTYLTDDKKDVTFFQMRAKGKIDIVLITNRIPSRLIDSYFDEIIKNSYINFVYKKFTGDSLSEKIVITDSINRAINNVRKN
jgi:hypothetical protein